MNGRRWSGALGVFAASVLAVGVAQHPARASGKTGSKTVEELPTAIMPCFETLPDGSTRVFVELSKSASYETKPAPGTLTIVLKGVRVEKRNNYNPLVTMYFNTPVTNAQLVPRGHDLWLQLALRASVEPAVRVDAGADGGAVMSVQFPKGDYLPPSKPDEQMVEPPVAPAAGEPAKVAPPAASAAPVSRPTPLNPSHVGSGRGRRRGGSMSSSSTP